MELLSFSYLNIWMRFSFYWLRCLFFSFLISFYFVCQHNFKSIWLYFLALFAQTSFDIHFICMSWLSVRRFFFSQSTSLFLYNKTLSHRTFTFGHFTVTVAIVNKCFDQTQHYIHIHNTKIMSRNGNWIEARKKTNKKSIVIVIVCERNSRKMKSHWEISTKPI